MYANIQWVDRCFTDTIHRDLSMSSRLLENAFFFAEAFVVETLGVTSRTFRLDEADVRNLEGSVCIEERWLSVNLYHCCSDRPSCSPLFGNQIKVVEQAWHFVWGDQEAVALALFIPETVAAALRCVEVDSLVHCLALLLLKIPYIVI